MTLALVLVVAIGLLLFVPDPEATVPPAAAASPFAWNQDAVWDALRERSETVRALPAEEARQVTEAALVQVESKLVPLRDLVATAPENLDDAAQDTLRQVELAYFEAAATLSGHPTPVAQVERLVAMQTELRDLMKTLSRSFRPGTPEARRVLYRALYGSRAALEEVLLQLAPEDMPVLSLGVQEPSGAPSAMVRGVRVHSGDILVSRGGAPTSALIARGNDYPGNFSHIALVHVSDDGEVRTVEAHIERGVVVAGIDRYIADPKLRVMLLRARADLPALQEDPALAHRVAEAALRDATERHIAYDFEMNYEDPETQFCSEVASANYHALGIDLWEGLTTTSDTGTARWLSSFGVREFRTHGPSDLEYDPKLVVVAEWRDPETLFADHVDTAVVDVLLEGASQGDTLEYDWRMLPVARVMKAYSVLLNLVGKEGPVPEGMSASVALRVKALRARHTAIRDGLLQEAEAWERERGYRAPYWELVRMARRHHRTEVPVDAR